ncbi:ABC-2 transporter permease [Roseivivax sp. CAU 1753]
MIFRSHRFVAVLEKEFLQFRRDRLTFGILSALPALLLLLYGYAIEIDARNLPAAVIDLSQTAQSRDFIAAVELTEYVRIDRINPAPEAANRAVLAGDYVFVLTIPSDFGRRVLRADAAPVLVEVDMSDPSGYGGAIAAIRAVAADFGRPASSGATQQEAGVALIVHRRFNPEGINHYVSVTGLLGLLLEITVMVAAGHALTRERERGTMENLLATPVNAGELMLGKIVPYIILGMVEAGIILTLAFFLFEVPFLGDWAVLGLACLVFVTSAVLFGYSISSFVDTQIQAAQLIVFYLTLSIMLSGFTFPFLGMPGWAQMVGEALPLTHFIRIVRSVMLKGAGFGEISDELIWLCGYVLLFAVLSIWRFRHTLD